VNGRKRHIATDTTGLLVVLVNAASVHDRDAVPKAVADLHVPAQDSGQVPFAENEHAVAALPGLGSLTNCPARRRSA